VWRGAIAGIVAALVLSAPAAAASRHDAASTHAFLVADARALRAAIAQQSQEAAAVNGLIEHVANVCPHVIPASLRCGTLDQQNTSTAFMVVGFDEVAFAEFGATRGVEAGFDRATAHLRWSNQALNRRIATSRRRGLALRALRPPDICQQAAIAEASNFARTPPAIRSFVRRFEAAAADPSSRVEDEVRLMTPLAKPRDLPMIRRVLRLQRRLSAILTRLADRGVSRLGDALVGS
jgi:hypothetical protein